MSATHLCRAINCTRTVQRKFLMCCFHWSVVPNWIRETVCIAYTPGQESGRKKIKPEWVLASREAIKFIAEKEGIEFTDDSGQPIAEKPSEETPPQPDAD